MNMTSNCDVTNSSHQMKMTTYVTEWNPMKIFCVRHWPFTILLYDGSVGTLGRVQVFKCSWKVHLCKNLCSCSFSVAYYQQPVTKEYCRSWHDLLRWVCFCSRGVILLYIFAIRFVVCILYCLLLFERKKIDNSNDSATPVVGDIC